MHTLQHKHSKIKADEAEVLLKKFNISTLQLPKIRKDDPALPPDAKIGDLIKIERKTEIGKVIYYRVVIPD